MPSPIYNIFTLSKAQINKLIKRHHKQLSGTITKEKLVYIVIHENVNDPVEVQDILGNILGTITCTEAWAL